MKITVPYNFVPLAKKVFFPDWSNDISHDVPFADGEDGVIKLSICNVTPLFTKNGTDKNSKEEFSSHIMLPDGSKRYFIPGSSVKGCIRSVMEILSFAKMQQYNNDSFGMVRDFDTHKTDNQQCGEALKNGKVFCGWLQQDNEGYILKECAEGVQKVSINDLKNKFPQFVHEGKINDTAEKKQKSLSPTNEFEYPRYTQDGKDYLVVCTGFMHGKEHEYLFSEKLKQGVLVDKEVVDAFESVHKNTAFYGGKNGKGGFLKKRLHKGNAIPVFFTKKNGAVDAMGITRMFRLPFPTTVSKAVNNTYNNSIDYNKTDLTEAIFGYVRPNGKSLKGRVTISHAFCSDNIPDNQLQTESGVLGQPSASYYPFFLKQNRAPYITYSNLGAEIAGRKRYRISKSDTFNNLTSPNDNANVKSTIHLIPKSHTFTCKILVHNLRPAEIGALISAITFNGTAGTYHNLGMAKNHGFGKVKCEIQLNGFKKTEQEYLLDFEKALAADGIAMAEEESVNKLIAIASETHNIEDMKFMDLKQYRELKQNNNFTLIGEKPATIATQVDPQEIRQQYLKLEYQRQQEKKLKEEAEKIEIRKQQYLAEEEENIQKAQNYMEDGMYSEAKQLLETALTVYKEYNIDVVAITDLLSQCDAAIASKNSTLNLDKKNTFGEYSIVKFNQLENAIKNWMKKNKATEINPSFNGEIIDCLMRLKQSTDKGERKEWDNPKSKRWDLIRSWIGSETDKLK